ncbi:MAG TPA: ribose-phosphate pyrophosphokinase [Rickettsia endosymbiont of Omalisus fontisbellaquei]|nr:ribose-phosphate pyrophosphokinase [Rickettsia endosymbiont of Omalisus fontisbellaquei]
MKILAGSSNKLLASRLAIALNIKYIEPKITYFNDSEIKVEIQESFHNEEVIIVQSTSKPVNDRLIELFLLLDAAKKAGANRIILIMPYFGYARQDNQSTIPARLIADFLEKLEVNHIITIDLHSDKIEKFFNIPVSNLEPINLYIPFLRTYSNSVIVAPDKGSINRVQKISNLLNIDSAYINKKRDKNNNCEMIEISGKAQGKNCILIDDIIDSGETIVKAARFLKEYSALAVSAFITHAVLSAGSKDKIENSAIDNIFVTDTIEVGDLSTKFHIIPVLPIIVRELRNIL